jgi:hypothetical protein
MSSFDLRNQKVRSQTIIGELNISQPAVDKNKCLAEGIAFYQACAFDEAQISLRKAVELQIGSHLAHLYLALAMLKRRRPKTISRRELDGIDACLAAASAAEPDEASLVWFRAVLRDDYFGGNRLICPRPTVQELTNAANAKKCTVSELKHLLAELPLSGELYTSLLRQIERLESDRSK